MSDHTHVITVECSYRYPHAASPGGSDSVAVAGEGDLAHYLTTFQAMLVAGGFSPKTASRLQVVGED